MKSSTKILAATTSMTFMLLMAFQLQPAHAELTSVEDRALAYVENVLPVDMSQYTIKSLGVYEPAGMPNSTVHTESVTFTLTSSLGGQLFANCMFHDCVQYSCSFQGSPISDNPYTSLVEETRSILERHRVQTGVDTTKLARMLDAVNLTSRAQIVTWGNLELGVSSSRLAIGLKMINGELHVDPTNTIGVTSFWWGLISSNETYFFIDYANGIFHSLYDWHTVGEIVVDGSAMTVVQLDTEGPDNPTLAIGPPTDSKPPQISNVSVENKTYDSNEIPLEFKLDENVTCITYSLDNHSNVTITGNTTLSGLRDGLHNLIIYATDCEGNVGASANITFIVTMEPLQTTAEQKAQVSMSMDFIAAALGITAFTAGLGILLYSKKRNKNNELRQSLRSY